MTRKKTKSQKNIATVLSAKSLGFSKNSLPHSIVEVVSTLQKAGYEAYIVGGGVRDGLLGFLPKDFDAVTNARPHEIKSIFGGRCRIIGKRFQLAHVYSGREMIEVATFRAPPKDDTHTTDDGMITRDNVWGTIEQDFARRDFSINALYYNPIKGEVLDFCGAIDDISSQKLRLLGDAKVRIEEDPVRLLRALRFKAKLGFVFDKSLDAQFNEQNWQLLEQVSAHRLYDETQKMFTGGYLAPLLDVLYQYKAIHHLMAHAPKEISKFVSEVAKNTDERIHQGKTANPAYFYAVLLWENYLHALAGFKKKGLPFYEAQQKAAAKVIAAQRLKTAIPRFAEDFISDIWAMQTKLVAPKSKDIDKLFASSKFRAAFDFLLMREQFDNHHLSEPTNGMAAWWLRYQIATINERAQMVLDLGDDTGRKSRRTRKAASNTNAELEQLQKLSMRASAQSEPKPLFVIDQPSPKARPAVPVPVFEKVAYSESDFLTLLNNDEPYIPARRYRKRQPSSTLSIAERKAGLSELSADKNNTPKNKASAPKNVASKPAKKTTKKTTAKKPINTTTDTNTAAANKKPKKRARKSNAKPKAEE